LLMPKMIRQWDGAAKHQRADMDCSHAENDKHHNIIALTLMLPLG
jgi:hypothetical protein